MWRRRHWGRDPPVHLPPHFSILPVLIPLNHLPPEQRVPIFVMLWLRPVKEVVTFLRGCPLPGAHQHGGETTAMPFPFSEDMARAQSKDTATRKLSADHALPCLLFGCAWSIPAAAGCAPPPCTDRRSLVPVGSPVWHTETRLGHISCSCPPRRRSRARSALVSPDRLF